LTTPKRMRFTCSAARSPTPLQTTKRTPLVYSKCGQSSGAAKARVVLKRATAPFCYSIKWRWLIAETDSPVEQAGFELGSHLCSPSWLRRKDSPNPRSSRRVTSWPMTPRVGWVGLLLVHFSHRRCDHVAELRPAIRYLASIEAGKTFPDPRSVVVYLL
jgi:hypothetical protein